MRLSVPKQKNWENSHFTFFTDYPEDSKSDFFKFFFFEEDTFISSVNDDEGKVWDLLEQQKQQPSLSKIRN